MKNGLYALVLVFMASCASRIAPSGGAPDKTPPKIVSVNPPTGSTEFRAEKIEIEFDEFVALKDGGSGIVVSPPLKTPPEATIKGKLLQLKFKETLAENTTYSITLGGSVVDITESNLLEEMQLVFATGLLLDTLKVTGRVENSYTNAAPKTAVVALYEAFHDSIPQTQLPRYFTRTDATGNFTINNIKAGKYRILAFEDANSDLKWNNPDESVAFVQDALEVDSGLTSIGTLRLFKEQPSRQRLVRSKFDTPGRITLKYAFAPEQLQFEAIGSIDVGKFIQTSPSKSDSITLWYPTSTLDSLNFIAKAISGDSLRSDTLHFSTKKTGSSAGRGKNKKLSADTLLQVSLNVTQGKLIEGDSLKIRFSAPLPQNNPSVIALMNETDTLQLAAVYKSPNQMLHVFALPKSNRAFTLSIAKGSFSDIFGRVCDSLKQSISYASEDDLGNLEFIFRNDSIQGFTGILELLDKNAALIQSRKITNTETLVFKALIPGEYTIRLTEELDANGTWTSGSLQQKRQPERMYYYPEKFSVRAGWDLELEWEPLKELGRKRRK
jgi:uncharacterized protein (DUF2141 family)